MIAVVAGLIQVAAMIFGPRHGVLSPVVVAGVWALRSRKSLAVAVLALVQKTKTLRGNNVFRLRDLDHDEGVFPNPSGSGYGQQCNRPISGAIGGSIRIRPCGGVRPIGRQTGWRPAYRGYEPCPGPGAATLARKAAKARGWFSTEVTLEAPQDSASRPRAPVPANRSKTGRPMRTFPNFPLVSIENKASRARSEVGRTSEPFTWGDEGASPRRLPATIRTGVSM